MNSTQSQPQESMVRVYTSAEDYGKDAKKLANQGWSVSNVTHRQPRAGCGRIIFLWWLTLLRPPKPELIVTYTRAKQ